MTTGVIGIDCATQAKNTGLAFGLSEDGRAQIQEVTAGSSQTDLVDTAVHWGTK